MFCKSSKIIYFSSISYINDLIVCCVSCRVVRVSAELACCTALPHARRIHAFESMTEAAKDLVPREDINPITPSITYIVFS